MDPCAPSSPDQPRPALPEIAAWPERLLALAHRLRAVAIQEKDQHADRLHPIAQGAGDVSFGPDVATEEILSTWFEEQARREPLSLLTEEAGWRHAGPSPGGATPGWRTLPDFDHGGVRITIDPIDGTRPWLHGLRSAWSILALAPPGPEQPQLADVVWGCAAEIPLPEAGWARCLTAARGAGCWRADVPLLGQAPRAKQRTQTRDPDRVGPGFYPFFAFHPSLRPRMAQGALHFFERLRDHEGLPLDQAYEDPYIASGGQFALLAMGHYPMLADLRPRVGAPDGSMTQCAKAYDVAGAIVCAIEAGAVVLDPDGQSLDGPLDATTPVGWVAYAGTRSQKRLHPHYLASRHNFF